jgi:hypothetical protein
MSVSSNKILVDIRYTFDDSFNYDAIIRKLTQSGVTAIVLIVYPEEATAFFNAVLTNEVLASDKVVYIGSDFCCVCILSLMAYILL